MKTVRQIIKEEIQLYETSMNRVLAHVKKESYPSWGIVTAFRGVNSKNVNKQINKQLAADIKSMGYGFIKLEGHWRECPDNTIKYADCPESELKDVAEQSFFIPGINFKQIAHLTKKYDQDSSVYSGKEVKDRIVLVSRDGDIDDIGSEATPNKISQAYSRLRGKPFVFEYNL